MELSIQLHDPSTSPLTLQGCTFPRLPSQWLIEHTAPANPSIKTFVIVCHGDLYSVKGNLEIKASPKADSLLTMRIQQYINKPLGFCYSKFKLELGECVTYLNLTIWLKWKINKEAHRVLRRQDSRWDSLPQEAHLQILLHGLVAHTVSWKLFLFPPLLDSSNRQPLITAWLCPRETIVMNSEI